MPVCSFCKRRYKEPRGLTVFTFDGRSVYFCSGKCRKNLKLGRDPKKVNWIRKGKESLQELDNVNLDIEETKDIIAEKKPETKDKTKNKQ